MGLDMYLYKKTYLFTGDWIKEGSRESVTILKGGEPHQTIKSDRVKYVIEEVGYWRKANAIHKWFVEHVQNGADDCGSYYVDRSQLEDLLDECTAVIQNKDIAAEQLPTTVGFFFGSTDYDEWYYDYIQQTIEIIKSCLSDDDANEFEYTSSW